MRTRFTRSGKKFSSPSPSKAHEDWFNAIIVGAANIAGQLRADGYPVPLAQLCNVRALIYRPRAGRMQGDAVGFYQAIGDLLQAAGIFADDDWIESWDGSRRLVDAEDPRVEIAITEAA